MFTCFLDVDELLIVLGCEGEPSEDATYLGCALLDERGVAILGDIYRARGLEPEGLSPVTDLLSPCPEMRASLQPVSGQR